MVSASRSISVEQIIGRISHLSLCSAEYSSVHVNCLL